MSQMTSEVIGVIELDLDAELFRVWMEDDFSKSSSDSISARLRTTATTSDVVVADVGQLSNDLRLELARILHRLRSSR